MLNGKLCPLSISYYAKFLQNTTSCSKLPLVQVLVQKLYSAKYSVATDFNTCSFIKRPTVVKFDDNRFPSLIFICTSFKIFYPLVAFRFPLNHSSGNSGNGIGYVLQNCTIHLNFRAALKHYVSLPYILHDALQHDLVGKSSRLFVVFTEKVRKYQVYLINLHWVYKRITLPVLAVLLPFFDCKKSAGMLYYVCDVCTFSRNDTFFIAVLSAFLPIILIHRDRVAM